jgi:CRP/FNR family transcriptional regulator
MSDPDAPRERLCALYPAIGELLDPVCLPAVRDHEVRMARVPARQVLFEEGTPCRGFPLVPEGEARGARLGAGPLDRGVLPWASRAAARCTRCSD